MRSMSLGTGLLAALMFLAAPLAAQQTETALDTVYEFPPFVIVGKPIIESNRIRDNQSLVTTVSSKQIEDMNAMDLPSALRRVPGVTISRYNLVGSYGGGEGGTVYIRGQGTERPGASIQMMVDGVPKYVGIWTHPLMDVLSVDHLERVEVYKSPQPVRMGNMSLGAVNLVSRRMHKQGTHTDLTTAAGEENTYNLVFNHGGKFDRFDYYFGSSVKGSDGHRPQSAGQTRSYWGRAGYRLSDVWDISFILSGSNNWADDPGAVGSPPPERARFKTDDVALNLTLANRGEKLSGYLKLYMDDGRINWEQMTEDNSEWFNSKSDWLNSGIRLRQSYMLTPMTELTAGLDYDSYGGNFVEQHQNPDNTLVMPEKYFYNTAAYVSLQHAFALGDGFTLSPSAGVRYNHHTEFDNEVAPQAGLSLSRDKWELYANYSRGFNYAGIYSVWFYNVMWNQPEQYENLGAEQLNHYEVGLKLDPSRRLHMAFSLFHDRGKDRIRMLPPPPPPPVFANVDRFEITGFELSANWAPLDMLALFSGLTVIGKSPETLPQAPGYTFTLGGNLRFLDDFQLSLDMQALDERYVVNPRFAAVDQLNPDMLGTADAYVIGNAKLSYYLGGLGGPKWQGTHAFIAVENFTGTDYEYKPGYPMPGATAMVGLTLDY